MKFQMTYEAPFGLIMLYADEKMVQGIDLFPEPSDIVSHSFEILYELEQQLNNYFFDENTQWNLPLAVKGTDFQQRVWRYMQAIPVGETRSYGEVAKALNSSARAVGNACRANPFPIVVPCHRVISETGLGGFAGQTSGDRINVKQWLLDHER